jgi:hypothetical protein
VSGRWKQGRNSATLLLVLLAGYSDGSRHKGLDSGTVGSSLLVQVVLSFTTTACSQPPKARHVYPPYISTYTISTTTRSGPMVLPLFPTHLDSLQMNPTVLTCAVTDRLGFHHWLFITSKLYPPFSCSAHPHLTPTLCRSPRISWSRHIHRGAPACTDGLNVIETRCVLITATRQYRGSAGCSQVCIFCDECGR